MKRVAAAAPMVFAVLGCRTAVARKAAGAVKARVCLRLDEGGFWARRNGDPGAER